MPSRYPQLTARCLDDGSFDPLQCFGDRCACVNSIYSGTVDDEMYYIHNGLNHMPCCKNISLKLYCFLNVVFLLWKDDRRIHRSSTIYEHECEKILADKLSEAYQFENEGFNIMAFTLDICELNGWYKRVKQDKES